MALLEEANEAILAASSEEREIEEHYASIQREIDRLDGNYDCSQIFITSI